MAQWRRTGVDDARIRQFRALHNEPSASNHAIRLEPDLADRSLRICGHIPNGPKILSRVSLTRNPAACFQGLRVV